MKITVLGCGAWGFAVGKLLSENGHDVMMWSHRSEAVTELLTGEWWSSLRNLNENKLLLSGLTRGLTY